MACRGYQGIEGFRIFLSAIGFRAQRILGYSLLELVTGEERRYIDSKKSFLAYS